MTKKSFLVKQVNILFTLYLLMLIGCSVLFYTKIEQLTKSYSLVNHSIKVKLRLEKVITNIKGAESAQRGFLLTEDSSFLEYYWKEQKSTRVILSSLDSLTGNSEYQNAKANELNTLVSERFSLFEKVLNSKSFFTSGPDERKVYLQNGTKVMRDIMTIYSEMKGHENKLLMKREAANNRNVHLTPIYILGIAMFSLFILIICQVVLMRINKGKIQTSR